jgi:hypothetical protein
MIESSSAIKTGKLRELSTTQILECNVDDMDCAGGDPHRVLKWLFDYQVNVKSEEEFEKSDCGETKEPGVRVSDYFMNE